MVSCNTEPTNNKKIGIDELFWLQGNWTYTSKNGTYYEKWVTTPSSFITGIGYFISTDNDTLYSQKMNIVVEDNSLFLVINAKNFNENRNIKFKFINTYSGNEFYFENLFKDYPQLIKYALINDTTCTVTMKGTYKNKSKTEEFNLIKTSN